MLPYLTSDRTICPANLLNTSVEQLIWEVPALFVIGSLATFVVNWLALVPWRRAAGAHWTERARLLWPARVSGAFNIFLIPGNLFLACCLLFPERPDGWYAAPLVISAGLGALVGTRHMSHEIFPDQSLLDWTHQVFVSLLLRFGILLVFVGGVVAMPEDFGWQACAVTAVVLLFHLWMQWGLGLKFLRASGLLKPAGERLYKIATETSTRLKVPIRGVWFLAGAAAQAYAMPTTRELLFTRPLLEISTDEEVSAICAHELAHLSESKRTLAGRIIGSLTLFPLLFIRPAMHVFGPIAISLLFAAMLLLSIFARKLSQRMETRADLVATENQSEAGAYASALEKLYRTNQIPAVTPRKRTHPHLYDRLLAAGITPNYPRPKAPAKFAWTGWLMLLSFGVLLGLLLARLDQGRTPPSTLLDVALTPR